MNVSGLLLLLPAPVADSSRGPRLATTETLLAAIRPHAPGAQA